MDELSVQLFKDGLCRFADDQFAVRLDRHRRFSGVADAPDEALCTISDGITWLAITFFDGIM